MNKPTTNTSNKTNKNQDCNETEKKNKPEACGTKSMQVKPVEQEKSEQYVAKHAKKSDCSN